MGFSWKKRLILSLLLNVLAPTLFAQSIHDATIARCFGKVSILKDPKKKVTGAGPHVLFEGFYYQRSRAKTGGIAPLGSVIQTGDKSRCRLIFANGDQISVSDHTSYKITKNPKAPDKPLIELFFGAIRSVIEKNGPRTGTEVRTRSLAMGVRGTEFHIRANGKGGRSAISVLRGKVALTTSNQSKPTEIPSGFSAEIKSDTKASAPKVNLIKTDRLELLAIQKSTTIAKSDAPLAFEGALDQVEKLEKKAVTVLLTDIKQEDPNLYQSLQKSGTGKDLSLNQLQTATVKEAYKKAPKKTSTRKPTKEELEMSDEDIYEKYFNDP